MTRCADAAVVDLLYALRPTLLDNFRGEISLVMRRTYARAELHDKVGRLRSKIRGHLLDCVRHHAKLCSFAARMDKSDRWRLRIDNVNRAAVGHVNAERDFSLLCDEAIATAELLIGSPRHIDNRNPAAVNLLGSHDREIGHADCAAYFTMRRVQAP